jgi:DNA-binding NtrC family response regulator
MRAESKRNILVLDDDQSFLDGMRRLLISNNSMDVVTLNKSCELLKVLEQREFAVLLMDWVMPDLGGADLLPVVVERYPDMPVIIMTGINDVQHIIDCIKLGAFDYIIKSIDNNRFLTSLDKACQFNEITRQNRQLKRYLLGETLLSPEIFSGILTINPHMQAIFKIIELMSMSSHPVMITGETGVGKELFARAIHRASGVNGDFVALNVAGLDDQMFTDTLFGHRKGAFTGAHEAREGLISKAQGGTLFLDEIGDLGSDSQVKLLRLLQEREYYRLGSDALIKSDARIITASNADFNAVVIQGQFRRDLYHRLRSHHIHIPPLRERPEDISLLIDHFIQNSAVSMGRTMPFLSREARNALVDYPFPGNVRELINLVHNAVACSNTDNLSLDDFPEIGSTPPFSQREFSVFQGKQFRINAIFPQFPSLEEVERLLIGEALRISAGNKSIAAGLLGVARSTLHRKLYSDEAE